MFEAFYAEELDAVVVVDFNQAFFYEPFGVFVGGDSIEMTFLCDDRCWLCSNFNEHHIDFLFFVVATELGEIGINHVVIF